MEVAQSYFHVDDFYTLEFIRSIKSSQNVFRVFRELYYWTRQAPVETGWNTHPITRKVIFNLEGVDTIKLAMSFIFWTQKLNTSYLITNTTSELEDVIHAYGSQLKVNRSDIYRIIDKWNSQTFNAAILYFLKYINPVSGWHYNMCNTILYAFMGAGGWESWSEVFDSRKLPVYNDYANNMQKLVDIYNNAMADPIMYLMDVPAKIQAHIDAKIENERQHQYLLRLLERYFQFTPSEIEYTLKNTKTKADQKLCLRLFLQKPILVPPNKAKYVEARLTLEQPADNCPLCFIQECIGDKCKFHYYKRPVLKAHVPLAKSAQPAQPAPSAPPLPAIPEALMCQICMDKTIDTRLDPCGHMYCYECAQIATHCHHCKTKIAKKEKTFIL